MNLNDKIQAINKSFQEDKKNFQSDLIKFDDLKNKYLGRRGLLSELYPLLNKLPDSDKPGYGKKINTVKNQLTLEISQLSNNKSLSESQIDIDSSMPGIERLSGSIHPLTKILNEIKDIFSKIGFSTIYGPEVDTDYYNFEALNIPKKSSC